MTRPGSAGDYAGADFGTSKQIRTAHRSQEQIVLDALLRIGKTA
ncbi:hypothetical protein ACWEOG_30500 [Amycolatopsis japonica]